MHHWSRGTSAHHLRGLVLAAGLVVLLAGCSEEGQEAARDRLEQAIEDADQDGVPDPDPTPPGESPEPAPPPEGADEGTSAGDTEQGEAAPAPSPTPEEEPAAEEPAGAEAADDAATTDAAAEDARSGWWLVTLLVIVAAVAIVTAVGHRHARQRERDALRDSALLDVDWLVAVSAEPVIPEALGTRVAEVRACADRLHHSLGSLASGADRETATAALQLREAALALAALAAERLAATVGAGGNLEARLNDERQRVRVARLRLVQATQ
jgi:hypothetical protein